MASPSERIGFLKQRMRLALPEGAKEPVIVAVTKGREPAEIFPYYEAGLRDFGENRVQEAIPKLDALPKDIKWHFIGRLQSNKVKDVVGRFALIHSVDSQELIRRIDARARELGIVQNILLQVNVSDEKTKGGFAPSEIKEVVSGISGFGNAKLLGLMTIARLGADEAELRSCFGGLKRLGEEFSLPELSMGMSGDFEIAVAEGASMVRIGRALFRETQA